MPTSIVAAWAWDADRAATALKHYAKVRFPDLEAVGVTLAKLLGAVMA